MCTYIYIPKYTLLSLYNITCMMFSFGPLVYSPPSFPQLPIVPCVGLKLLAHPCGMSIGDILVQLTLGQTCW